MIILISGPDGVGKSTIGNALYEYLADRKLPVTLKWMRYAKLTSRCFNLLMICIGKNYKVRHEWGAIGYHDYRGLLGKLYINLVFFDFIVLQYLVHRKLINKKVLPGEYLILDRYLVDIVADLMVDTQCYDYVLKRFNNKLLSFLEISNVYLIECDYATVVKRRPDIIDDKKYFLRRKAYDVISDAYPAIIKIDSSVVSPKQLVATLFSRLKL